MAILQENMVIANLVHRDFENEIRQFGDVVNTRRPGTFQIRRKVDGTPLENQDASSQLVQVPLNQWFYTSFTIRDGEASKSFQDLVDIYLRPGMMTIARSVDRAVLGRAPAFLTPSYANGGPGGRVGQLGLLSAMNSKDYVLEAREQLNINKAPLDGRNLVLAPSSETALLKNELFIAAQKRGDFGSALESATLGRILGFDTYMDQNVNAVPAGAGDYVTGTVTPAIAAGAGGTLAIVFTADIVLNGGEFMVIAGNGQPQFAVNPTGSPTTTAITLNEVNKYATQAVAPVTVYTACQLVSPASYVSGATVYGAGWATELYLNGWTNAPAVGQMLAFGASNSARTVYTVIESYLVASSGSPGASVQAVILDRPLDAATAGSGGLAGGVYAFPGPAGALNLAFHRNAIALVTRPLAVPNNAMGVLAHVGVYNDIAMRVSMQYSIANGGTVVNLDILAGVAVLDDRLCVVLQG